MNEIVYYDAEDLIYKAFKTIFNPTIDKGFYDDVFGVYPIIEYTIHKDTIVHVPKNKRYWRYNPFLMMGVLYSRLHIQSNQIKSYDDKIKKQLDIFIAKFSKKDINSLCSYSLGPLMIAFLFAHRIYGDNKYMEMVNYIVDNIKYKIEVNEDAFLLLGLSYVYEFNQNRSDLLDKILHITNEILKHQNNSGLFDFKNIVSKRHQNQMYTLWALNKSFKILNIKDTEPIRKNIEYTIRNRIEADMSIIWEDNIPQYIKMYHIITKRRYWRYYFECHQCFFAHAVYGYSNLSMYTKYNDIAKEALEWIFGTNRFGIDLLDASILDVPHRIIDCDGNIHVKGQQFKGTYEIGGYLLALTDYIQQSREF